MMGQSGVLPGAIRPEDIPAALERLKKEVAAHPATAPQRGDKDDGAPGVSLRQRAFPLIELLERAAKRGCYVIWEEQR
jgi:hypothetical protein